MVVFVAVFFFPPLALLVWDMLQGGEGAGGGGGLRLGVNIVKCRVQECHNLSVCLKLPTFDL